MPLHSSRHLSVLRVSPTGTPARNDRRYRSEMNVGVPSTSSPGPFTRDTPNKRLIEANEELAFSNLTLKNCETLNISLRKLLIQEAPDSFDLLGLKPRPGEDLAATRPPQYRFKKAVLIQNQTDVDDDNDGDQRLAATDSVPYAVQRNIVMAAWRASVFAVTAADVVLLALYLCIVARSEVSVIEKYPLYWKLSLVFLGVFAFNISLRIATQRVSYFMDSPRSFRTLRWRNTLDAALIYFCCIGVIVVAYVHDVIFKAALIARLVSRVILLPDYYASVGEAIKGNLRVKVSENKRRYMKDGWDLDLTYITNRMLAMSLPSEGTEELYRNPITQVAAFLSRHHYGHFKVFNFCKERTYDHSKLFDQVLDFCFDDHGPPTMQIMMDYLASVKAFLLQDDNVIVAHCKGGKGRTGCLIAAALMYTGHCLTAEAALDLFARRRTVDLSLGSQGVTSPSQIRYVHYLERVLYENFDYATKKSLFLTNIRMSPIPKTPDQAVFSFLVYCEENLVYDNRKSDDLTVFKNNKSALDFITAVPGVRVFNDVKIEFFVQDSPTATPRLLFFVVFHCSFVPGDVVLFPKSEVDMAYRDNSGTFSPDFCVSLSFTQQPEALTTSWVNPFRKKKHAGGVVFSEDYAMRVFMTHGTLKHFDFGDNLIVAGQHQDSLMLITQGSARVVVGENSKQLSVNDVVGEISFLLHCPATATVSANEPMEVRVLSRAESQSEFEGLRLEGVSDQELISVYYLLACKLVGRLNPITFLPGNLWHVLHADPELEIARSLGLGHSAPALFAQHCAAKFLAPDTEVDGRVYVFQTHLCFEPLFFGVRRAKFTVKMEHIEGADLFGDTVTVPIFCEYYCGSAMFVFVDSKQCREFCHALEPAFAVVAQPGSTGGTRQLSKSPRSPRGQQRSPRTPPRGRRFSLSRRPSLSILSGRRPSLANNVFEGAANVRNQERNFFGLEVLLKSTNKNIYPVDRVILEQGCTEKALYYVVSGSVRVEHNRKLIRILNPGSVFGEVSFLETGNMGAGASVVSGGAGTEIASMSYDSLLKHFLTTPISGALLFEFLCHLILRKQCTPPTTSQ